MTSSAAPDRPLRRDAERNRQRILEAARAVFAERGLGATMDDVAHHAGVGVGTVYRRFPDKDLLIDALFEEGVASIVRLAEEALAHPDAWEALTGFLERTLTLQAHDRGLKELLLATERGRDRVRTMRERVRPVVEQLVTRAQDSGELRGDLDASDVALIQVMVSSVVDFTRDVEPEVWRRCLAVVLDGLRSSRDAPTPLPAKPLDRDQVDAAMRCWRPSR